MSNLIKFVTRKKIDVQRRFLVFLSRWIKIHREQLFLRYLEKGQTPILVYQMGKVASASIYTSLRACYNGLVVHTHTFSKDDENEEAKLIYDLYVRKKFKLKIVSLVREPIARNISAFFQVFERLVGMEYKKSKHTPKELQDIFLKKCNHTLPLNWFDDNIKNKFGIDVYKEPFPERNYALFQHQNVELLLMKHDLDDAIKVRVIGDFIDLKNFILKNENISASKEYKHSYKKVKNLPLPEWYIDKMLNTKYFRQFYSKESVNIRAKWSIKKINDDNN